MTLTNASYVNNRYSHVIVLYAYMLLLHVTYVHTLHVLVVYLDGVIIHMLIIRKYWLTCIYMHIVCKNRFKKKKKNQSKCQLSISS